MHELPVTQSILEITLRHAREAGALRVVTIYLVIGQLSSFVDDSIQFYWDLLSQDSLAEGARLDFHRIPAELFCLDCQRHYQLDTGELACPDCESNRVKIIAGEEFYLEAIDVETTPEPEPSSTGAGR